jgi:hypothetical protein
MVALRAPERLADGRQRRGFSWSGGRCELAAEHHGPCVAGNFLWHEMQPHKDCAECDWIDAAEVLRLDAGGDLRPLQRAPAWLKCPSLRSRMVTWARSLTGGASLGAKRRPSAAKW